MIGIWSAPCNIPDSGCWMRKSASSGRGFVQMRRHTLNLLRVLQEALQVRMDQDQKAVDAKEARASIPLRVNLYVKIEIFFLVAEENLHWQFDWVSGLVNPVFANYLAQEHPEAFKSRCMAQG